jgi:hypothetical protein
MLEITRNINTAKLRVPRDQSKSIAIGLNVKPIAKREPPFTSNTKKPVTKTARYPFINTAR